jgi:hypothetical protein
MNGYYRMARGWRDHRLFGDDPYSRRDAWGWLIENAAFRPCKVSVGTKEITLERGQLCFSIRFLAGAWKWSPRKVQRFLDHLRGWHGIATATATASATAQTVITLCNYDKYQATSGNAATASATPLDAEVPQIRKKENTSPNGEASSMKLGEVIDLGGMAFKVGRPLLARSGIAAKQTGTLIGGWLKKVSPAVLLEIFQESSRAERDDIVAYIVGCLRQRKRDGTPSNPSTGTPEHEEAKRKWGYDA